MFNINGVDLIELIDKYCIEDPAIKITRAVLLSKNENSTKIEYKNILDS